MNDEDHEAHGAMIYRGKREAEQTKSKGDLREHVDRAIAMARFGGHSEADAAIALVIEECALVADRKRQYVASDGSEYELACRHIAASIRALKESGHD